MGDCPSHLMLSRLKADDLKPAEVQAVSSHIAGCEVCAALSLSMDENIKSFESKMAQSMAALSSRMDDIVVADRRRTGRRLFAVGTVFAAAAAALLVFMLGFQKQNEPEDEGGVRFKGGLSLEITAARGTDQFPVKDGTRLREGDRVRFSVTVDRPGYLTVFSVEADGTISPFYPDTPVDEAAESLALDKAGRHTLQGSILLDNAVGEERFWVVFSVRPFDRNAVMKSVVDGSGLVGSAGLGPGFSVQSIGILKGD